MRKPFIETLTKLAPGLKLLVSLNATTKSNITTITPKNIFNLFIDLFLIRPFVPSPILTPSFIPRDKVDEGIR